MAGGGHGMARDTGRASLFCSRLFLAQQLHIEPTYTAARGGSAGSREGEGPGPGPGLRDQDQGPGPGNRGCFNSNSNWPTEDKAGTAGGVLRGAGAAPSARQRPPTANGAAAPAPRPRPKTRDGGGRVFRAPSAGPAGSRVLQLQNREKRKAKAKAKAGKLSRHLALGT